MAQSTSLLHQLGTRLAGRYELVAAIGHGASGIVYKAIDHELFEQVVAVKVLYPHLLENPEVVTRFRNEVRIARDLAHPHIVRVYEWCATSDDTYAVVMEFVAGVPLNKLLDSAPRRQLPIDSVCRILYEVADALTTAHSRGIVHRDLKPENLMLDESGHVKILDFGIARALDDERRLTRTGEASGTPCYMSPEQFRGEPPDPRSDLYSLGILGFELTTGVLPFQADAFYQLAVQHLSEPLPSINGYRQVPDWLVDLITRAAKKTLDERPETAEEIATTLAEHLDPGLLRGHQDLVRNWRLKELSHRKRVRLRRIRRIGLFILALPLIALICYSIAAAVNNRQWRYLAAGCHVVERYTGSWLIQPYKWLMHVDNSINDPDALAKALQYRASPVAKSEWVYRRLDNAITALLLAGANPNITVEIDGVRAPLVFWLAKDGDDFSLQLVTTSPDFNPNIRNEDGRTLASYGVEFGIPSLPGLLLAHVDFDPSLPDAATGDTAIHVAVNRLRNQLVWDFVQHLNKRGIGPNQRNLAGETPLDLALSLPSSAQPAVVESLLRSPYLDRKTPDSSGRSPLRRAAELATEDAVLQLIRVLKQSGELEQESLGAVAELLQKRGFTRALAALPQPVPESTTPQ